MAVANPIEKLQKVDRDSLVATVCVGHHPSLDSQERVVLTAKCGVADDDARWL